MFGMLWISVYDSVFQFLPTSSSFAQPLKRSGPTLSLATNNNLINSMRRRCVALREANGGHTRYWLVFGQFYCIGTPQYSKTAHFRVTFYCGQPEAHLCNNHAVQSASWYAKPVRWMDYLGKVLTNTDLDRFVNNIWEKWAFCVHRKSLRSLSSAHENWGKNKSVACLILFSIERVV